MSEIPKAIRGFICHGLELDIKGEGDGAQGWGDCPLCGGEGKFCVAVSSGKWDCKRCKKSGNIYTFLRELHKVSLTATTAEDYKGLARERKLLFSDTPKHWGLVKSVLNDDWLVPGYAADGKLNNLYRYTLVRRQNRKTGKWESAYELRCTDGLTHYLHGVNLYDKKKPNVYLCEGPWDGMALWEILRHSVIKDTKIVSQVPMKNPNNLTNSNVLAVPGSGVFFGSWVSLFSQKIVHLIYDSDYDSINRVNNKPIPNSAAGYNGMKRAYSVMHGSADTTTTAKPVSNKSPVANLALPPAEVRYIHWGANGYDPDLPDGYDIRDHFSPGKTVGERVTLLRSLLAKLVVAPPTWRTQKEGQTEQVPTIFCDNYKKLINQWRKALKWTDGLEHAFSACLACVFAIPTIGPQIWLRVISPPSTGKTDICEALSVNRRFCHPESNIRGFHSGYRRKDGKDVSLLEKVKGKALITKDGDTLLKSPNYDQIMAEARDAFDTSSRSDYRHGEGKAYEGYRFAWILAGTKELKNLDSNSELGQRFLTVVIVRKIDDDLEDLISGRVANQILDNRGVAGSRLETHRSQDMSLAMSMTAGYLNYLRENVEDLYKGVKAGQDLINAVIKIGKFVAYMRATPPQKGNDTDSREMSPRLVAQHTKLALCLAAVKNKTEVDLEVLQQVTKVGFDTADTKTLEIVKYLAEVGDADLKVLTMRFFMEEARGKAYIGFLRRLGVLESFTKTSASSIKGAGRWRLTDKIRKLYSDVLQYHVDEEA